METTSGIKISFVNQSDFCDIVGKFDLSEFKNEDDIWDMLKASPKMLKACEALASIFPHNDEIDAETEAMLVMAAVGLAKEAINFRKES